MKSCNAFFAKGIVILNQKERLFPQISYIEILLLVLLVANTIRSLCLVLTKKVSLVEKTLLI